MKGINETDLRLVDSSILMIFLGLMRHRKATLVARDMGITQPAVSHALKRLRGLFHDPLFLRKPYGLEPTAAARELEPKIRRIILLLSETLNAQQGFDPGQGDILLRIAAFDYELATILPELVTSLVKQNGNVRIIGLPLSGDEALNALVNSTVDVALGYFEFSPKRSASSSFVSEDLYSERYVLTARRGHPLFSKDLSLLEFSDADHLLVSPFGLVKGMIDHALQSKGLQRNVQATVPSLFPALAILERSDLVASLPLRVAELNANRFNLDFAPLPIDGGSFPISAVRHARDAHSNIHEWLIDLLHSQINENSARP